MSDRRAGHRAGDDSQRLARRIAAGRSDPLRGVARHPHDVRHHLLRLPKDVMVDALMDVAHHAPVSAEAAGESIVDVPGAVTCRAQEFTRLLEV